jgi:hypothetical protein
MCCLLHDVRKSLVYAVVFTVMCLLLYMFLDACRVRLIDFTASRLQTPGGDVVFCDLEAEDGIFEGPKGQPQFETYRWVQTTSVITKAMKHSKHLALSLVRTEAHFTFASCNCLLV